MKKIVLTSAALGLLVSIIITSIGIKHNSQGEFYDTKMGGYDFLYILTIFASWFLLSFIVFFLLSMMLRAIFLRIRRE